MSEVESPDGRERPELGGDRTQGSEPDVPRHFESLNPLESGSGSPVELVGDVAPPVGEAAPPGAAASALRHYTPDVSDIGRFFAETRLFRVSGLEGQDVVVVGAGAIGMLTALEGFAAGANVTVIDDGVDPTVMVAAGWGWPYHASDPTAGRLTIDAMKLWENLATILPAGSLTKEYTEVQRRGAAAPFPPELQSLQGYGKLEKRMLAPGFTEGVRAYSYVTPAAIWHPAIERMLRAGGVEFQRHHVNSAAELDGLAREADFVVNATGLGTALMMDDSSFQPIRGTVVHLARPEQFRGVWAWDLADGDNMDPYVITQMARNRVIVGGETTPVSLREYREWLEGGRRPNTTLAAMILERAFAFAPALRGCQELEVQTGMRPGRDQILLGLDDEVPNLIHASGFAGFGVTVAPAVGKRIVETMIVFAERKGRPRR